MMKNRIFRKLLSVTLSIILSAGAAITVMPQLSGNNSAVNAVNLDYTTRFYYTVSNSICTITGYDGDKPIITIPEKIGSYTVKATPHRDCASDFEHNFLSD